LRMGQITTVFGIAISIACAYVATRFDNIMDMLQTIFSFVNAPLLATFLLGMFWRRATGHGAFWGLISGTTVALLHHGLTAPASATTLIKGGWLYALFAGAPVALKSGGLHQYPVEMAQNFYGAIYAWATTFVVTILVSLSTRPLKSNVDLRGLVYSLTPRLKEHGVPWFKKPAILGIVVLAIALVLNLFFW
ncbi:MAG: Na+/galactose cotransporter, partial [Candidatus Omnitrophica bacterium]|nr:Na+/galactose cotransporter [Candidatus Omnitrophota bacterium]